MHACTRARACAHTHARTLLHLDLQELAIETNATKIVAWAATLNATIRRSKDAYYTLQLGDQAGRLLGEPASATAAAAAAAAVARTGAGGLVVAAPETMKP